MTASAYRERVLDIVRQRLQQQLGRGQGFLASEMWRMQQDDSVEVDVGKRANHDAEAVGQK